MLAVGLGSADPLSRDLAFIPALAAYWDNLPGPVCIFARAPVFACSNSELGQDKVKSAEQEETEITEEFIPSLGPAKVSFECLLAFQLC